MSKSAILKASAIITGLLVLAIIPYQILAQNQLKRPGGVVPLTKSDATSTAATKKQLVQQRLENIKENVENKIAAIKERQASREAALKTRLQAFKDKTKAEIAERINAALKRINQNQTDQMQRHLNKMSEILDKLESRVNQGRPDIKDPAEARAAIASARADIATASAAVSDQALKDYTIAVTSESRIRVDAKTQRDKLHTDLTALRKIVRDAKHAVANAIRVAKSGLVVDGPGTNKEGTTSGTQ